MKSFNATEPAEDTHALDSPTKMRQAGPRDEVDPPHLSVNPVETPSMPVRATRTTATIALTAVLALSACGGGDEPPPKETTSSSTTDKDQALSESAEKAYREYWRYANATPGSEVPGPEYKATMTDRLYKATADIAKRSTKTRVEGRDKLLSADADVEKTTGGYTATVHACYEVHRRSLALEAGNLESDSWKKGEDLRVDGEGQPIKPGTKMVNAVTLKRGKAENSDWLVDGGKIDVDKPCNDGG